MSKRKTKEEFVVQAMKTHSNKYDYSKVEYIGALQKVCIICPKHGEFYQAPIHHIRGNGCPHCYQESKKTLVFGKGITDVDNVSRTKCYSFWKDMMRRCYDEHLLKREPTYIGCSVCVEWLLFSNFKRWFDKHYVEGWSLDKDILIKGNKVYSPQTCCFVPKIINNLFTKRQNHRGEYPIGIHRANKRGFKVLLSKNSKLVNVGFFESEQDAFNAYKKAKEDYIQNVATQYRGFIEERVFDALMNYEVEITD